MTTSTVHVALDHHFELHCDDPGLAELVHRVFHPLADPDASAAHTYRIRQLSCRDAARFEVTFDGRRILAEADAEVVIEHLCWHVNRTAAAMVSDLALHASAIASVQGTALFPGPSGSGKSSIAAALAVRGLGYVTDELAAIDRVTLLVRPYPRCVSLSPVSRQAVRDTAPRSHEVRAVWGGKWHLDSSGFRMPAPSTRRVAVVVLPRFDRSARTGLTPLRPAELAAELARNSFNLARLGQRGLDDVADLAIAVPGYRLVFGRLDEALSALSSLGWDGDRGPASHSL